MTKEELKIQLSNLEKKHEADKKELLQIYAESNNPYKIDDIVTDHRGSIKVDKITCHYDGTCIYWGLKVKKDGSFYRTMQRECVYQKNVR
ncbi:MAG: hypothetical protein WC516_06705 [Patescibacteria group bacterium]|jgi:hypothetical protein